MDYNSISNVAMDMALGLAGAAGLLSIYKLKQERLADSLLLQNNALGYVDRYVESLREEFPAEFQPRENKPGLVKTL
jgi:hypothetical protein